MLTSSDVTQHPSYCGNISPLRLCFILLLIAHVLLHETLVNILPDVLCKHVRIIVL